ncbi:transposase [Leucobacter sp. gxy201]|uniref:transposase n=1 Tax=Leucobacter sp. gxy201 TaxID=2957200 RepID=UPI003DA036F8
MPAPRKYDDETRARAIRMYQDRLTEGGISQAAARREIGELIGVNPDTLRGWLRREFGEGVTPSATDAESASGEIARLRRENAQLKRANEILKTASAFFAAAELDRKLGQ